MILLEKSFSQGSIITWGRNWLNTPHFCQSIRSCYSVVCHRGGGATSGIQKSEGLSMTRAMKKEQA
jgi:hypothetical protein